MTIPNNPHNTYKMLQYFNQINAAATVSVSSTTETWNNTDISFSKQMFYLLQQNIDNTIFSVTDLAMALHVSERQLRRRCKILTNLSPRNLIIEYRLFKAMQLLKETHCFTNVYEVAQQVGFNNADYFSRLFIQRFGQRPSDLL